jgi:hypothetical protein
MENDFQEHINESDVNYVIISKNKEDILNEIDFNNEEERFLCDAIITNLEKYAANSIRNMKATQLPYIGTLRINPVKRQFRDAKLHLSSVRKNITKEQYKEHVRSYINDLKEKQKKLDKIKLTMLHIRRKNKKKYDALYKRLGKNYAELYIMSIYWLTEVPFNLEWEEHYQSLKE